LPLRWRAVARTSGGRGGDRLFQLRDRPARNQYTGKLEDITSWWRVSLSYLRYFSLEPGNTEFPTASSPNQWRLQRRVDSTQVNSILTLNPTTVLTLRYGFNRFPNYTYETSQGFDLAASPRASELGHVRLQELCDQGDGEGSVPMRSAECPQYTALLRSECFVREQQLREDYNPG